MSSRRSSETLVQPQPHVHPKLRTYQDSLDAITGLNRVGSRTWCTVGFGGNINFIEGDSGVIVINTGTTVGVSQQALDLFRKQCSKPIVAVVYTHGYSDHTGGGRVFVRPGEEDRIDVYASSVWPGYVRQAGSPMQPEVVLRAAAQLGWLLPTGDDGTVGNALSRPIRGAGGSSYVRPTVDVAERTAYTIAGVTLEMIPAPHDLDDGMIVWMPDERILFGGDTLLLSDIYITLATPRFEARRDPQKWIASTALAASLDAEHIVNAYGPPVSGAAEVRDRLISQQRVAQFMIDDVYRRILRGEHADRIAADFRLPASVTGGRTYHEYYHRLPWIIRSLVSREFGHYSGDVLDLVRLPPQEGAAAMVAELGGADEVVDRARRAYDRGDHRWAMELATLALNLDGSDADARAVRHAAMRALAYASDSANERNYLLTSILLEDGSLDRAAMLRMIVGTAPTDVSLLKPPAQMLDFLGPKLRPESGRPPLSVRFALTDRPDLLDMTILEDVMLRNAVAGASPQITIRLTHDALIRLVEGMNTLDELRSQGALEVSSDSQPLSAFEKAFDWRHENAPTTGSQEKQGY